MYSQPLIGSKVCMVSHEFRNVTLMSSKIRNLPKVSHGVKNRLMRYNMQGPVPFAFGTPTSSRVSEFSQAIYMLQKPIATFPDLFCVRYCKSYIMLNKNPNLGEQSVLAAAK